MINKQQEVGRSVWAYEYVWLVVDLMKNKASILCTYATIILLRSITRSMLISLCVWIDRNVYRFHKYKDVFTRVEQEQIDRFSDQFVCNSWVKIYILDISIIVDEFHRRNVYRYGVLHLTRDQRPRSILQKINGSQKL